MSSKIKIGLFLSSNESSGGTFQYNYTIYEILNRMVNNEFELVIFYTDDIWKNSYLKNTRSIKVSISKYFRLIFRISIFLNFSLFVLKKVFNFFEVIKTLENEKCDFIIYPSQDYISTLTVTPAIVAIHDLMHRYEKHYSEYSNGEIRRRDYIYDKICKNSKLILCDSECGRLHIIESFKVNYDSIHILPFIPPTYFDSCEIIDIADRYGISDEFIFYPAAFWEHKNHKNLIFAFKKLILDYPDIKLVLVGAKKNNYEKTLHLINDQGLNNSIYILNYVDNNTIYTLYKKCKLMTFVSFLGPTNIPPIEAISLNTPFICSNVYGMPEQIKNCGILVDPHIPSEIYFGMKKILSSNYSFADMNNEYETRKKELQNEFQHSLSQIIIKLKNE